MILIRVINIWLFLEGPGPPRLSHRVRGWGNRVSPSPCARAAPAHILLPAGGRETRFPHTPLRELMFTLETTIQNAKSKI